MGLSFVRVRFTLYTPVVSLHCVPSTSRPRRSCAVPRMLHHYTQAHTLAKERPRLNLKSHICRGWGHISEAGKVRWTCKSCVRRLNSHLKCTEALQLRSLTVSCDERVCDERVTGLRSSFWELYTRYTVRAGKISSFKVLLGHSLRKCCKSSKILGPNSVSAPSHHYAGNILPQTIDSSSDAVIGLDWLVGHDWDLIGIDCQYVVFLAHSSESCFFYPLT